MLLAEIHGKSVAEARDAEDYLTSAVFGHLRYVSPAVFWPELFAAAGLVLPAGATDLDVRFWPRTNGDEPDLKLTLSYPNRPPVVVVIEVKLWASKSGTGERDQLIRYLRGVPGASLVYLTPGDPFAEIADSLNSSIAQEGDKLRLFGLRWQTLHDIARRTAATTTLEPAKLILSDVAKFLDRMGLSGFDSWKGYPDLSTLTPTRAPWATLFRTIPNLNITPTPPGGPMEADYGKQVGKAFEAVYQLHKDVSRLLADCIGVLGKGRKTPHWPYVFLGVSGSAHDTEKWMPFATRRYFTGGDLPPSAAEFVLAYFWSPLPYPQEPLLVVGRVTYHPTESAEIKPDFYDAWTLAFEQGGPLAVGEVTRHVLSEHERIASADVLAVPLFSINSVDDVLKHMEEVRKRAKQG